MRLSVGQTVFSVYALVFAASVALSATVYWRGQAAVGATSHLVDQDIPTLRTLSVLKTDVVALEPIVYQYYVRLDRETFLRDRHATDERIERNLAAMGAAFPGDPGPAGIERQYRLITALVDRLSTILGTRPLDRERASALLAAITDRCMEINDDVDRLAASIHRAIGDRGASARRTIESIAGLVAAFTALLFIVALIGGGYARAYLAEGAARRRLTLFAERNPNPVFRLARDGTVRYANPGAAAALPGLCVDCGVEDLLPGDLAQRLDTLVESGRDRERWEYAVHGRIFGCALHYLEDYDEFHAYLADITERKHAEQQLAHFAYHDSLTGLPNRRRFLERLDALTSAGAATAVVLLSLDRFKLVIQSLGHTAGDRLLMAAAQRLGGLLESAPEGGDERTLYRFDGDLFAILANNMAVPDAAVPLADHLAAAMETPLAVDGREFVATVSIGVAVYPDDGSDAETLMKSAGSALHRMMQDGGNGVRRCSPQLSASALARLEMEAALRRALAEEQLEVHYQPQVEIAGGRLVGVEALVRWRDPDRGMISPGEFIPLAEETGLIVPLGEWVLRTACARNRAWQAAGWPPMTVAVNLSARQFRGHALPELLSRVLQDTGLEARYLELEVTESVAMHDVDATIATLQALKAIGVHLAIDDFGTGYSSLAYLKRFPVDKLKVDQSFVRHMASDSNDAAIVQSVIALGHALGLTVIAEGVETEAQLARLKEYGCEEMQGYLLSRPLPAEELAALLARRSGASNTRGTVAAVRAP